MYGKLIVLFIFIYSSASSQSSIEGWTKDGNGKPLPFTTVYIKGSTIGTTSNAMGRYVLDTKPGNYAIVAQHVGYKIMEKKVQVNGESKVELNFILPEQALQLRTVVVTAGDEDPAYRVIRQAIAKRKFTKMQLKPSR